MRFEIPKGDAVVDWETVGSMDGSDVSVPGPGVRCQVLQRLAGRRRGGFITNDRTNVCICQPRFWVEKRKVISEQFSGVSGMAMGDLVKMVEPGIPPCISTECTW